MLVLVVLCAGAQRRSRSSSSIPAARPAAGSLPSEFAAPGAAAAQSVLIVVRDTAEDAAFAAALEQQSTAGGFSVVETVRGQPVDARRAINRAEAAGATIDVIAANDVTASWGVLEDLAALGPAERCKVVSPPSYSGRTSSRSTTC